MARSRRVRYRTALTAQYRVPTIYPRLEQAAAGGLITYAANVAYAYRRAGLVAGLILNGAKPADLPVELPTKFELAINLKTPLRSPTRAPASLTG